MSTPTTTKTTTVHVRIFNAVQQLRLTRKYNGHWIRADVLRELILIDGNSNHYTEDDLDPSLVSVPNIIKTFGMANFTYVDNTNTPNALGVFRLLLRRNYLQNGKKHFKREYYFYLTRNINSIPPKNKNWITKAITDKQKLLPTRRSARNKKNQHQQQRISNVINSDKDDWNSNKSKRLNEIDVPIGTITSCALMKETKWDSPEAHSLFVYDKKVNRQREEEEDIQDSNTTTTNTTTKVDVKKHVLNQVTLLRKAFLTSDGWKDIIDDKDDGGFCTQHDIFSIRKKARYLSLTLSYALKDYLTTPRFIDICASAIASINNTDFDNCDGLLDFEGKERLQIVNPKTIMQWLRVFRGNNTFPNPGTARSHHWRSRLPPLFSNNSDLHQAFMTHAKCNLNSLTTEMLHQYLFSTALPQVVTRIQNERGLAADEYTIKDLLHDNGLPCLSLRTLTNWMNLLGFKYSPVKKCYYVDSHEKPENVHYRSQFLERYMRYELCAHRWIQIPIARYDTMVEMGQLSELSGFKYDKGGSTLVELHVDDHYIFQDECNNLPYGGHLSVRKPPTSRPLILIGQDESIFKQYCLRSHSWVAPDGTRGLLPKDEGQGVMVSSFVSREFGYGMEITPADLHKINRRRERRGHNCYLDEEAAQLKHGTTKKSMLTSSPFTRLLEYGINGEGYWTYESMIIQLEDCMDCLSVLHPSLDFVYLFDHSNGHDRLQPNGLSSTRISKYYGGKQPIMRDSVLTDIKCFGPFHDHTYPLQFNSTQSMIFQTTDPGPFYLTEDDRQKRKHDIRTGRMKKKFKVKSQLREDLKKNNILKPSGSLKLLQEQCKRLDIPITCEVEVVEDGWLGKPKGSFQVLYERGWIDITKIRKYTEKGKVNEMGILDESFSTSQLIKKQPDFIGELTLLQYYAKKMGATVDRSPKCHPEIAGEGIEYVWALAKLYYRGKPIERKRTKKKYRELVDECLSVVNLTKTRVRKCSRRAREYMLAYLAYDAIKKEHEDRMTRSRVSNTAADAHPTQTDTTLDTLLHMNYKLIEKSIKTFKTHRNARDFDDTFIRRLQLDDEEVRLVKCVVDEMKKPKIEQLAA
jgi:hypothetical protein